MQGFGRQHDLPQRYCQRKQDETQRDDKKYNPYLVHVPKEWQGAEQTRDQTDDAESLCSLYQVYTSMKVIELRFNDFVVIKFFGLSKLSNVIRKMRKAMSISQDKERRRGKNQSRRTDIKCHYSAV